MRTHARTHKPVCLRTKQRHAVTSPRREINSQKWFCFTSILALNRAPTCGHVQPCSKDEECCSDQTCVWGQCTVNATSGTEGTICQGQSDCRSDLCCAFQPGEPSSGHGSENRSFFSFNALHRALLLTSQYIPLFPTPPSSCTLNRVSSQ